jgi:hypothetical protein
VAELRHSATSRKFAASIPVGVIKKFIPLILPAVLSPLRSTQPLTEKSNRAISWRQRLMADNFTTFMYRLWRNSRSLNLLKPQEPVQGCNGILLHSTGNIDQTRLQSKGCFFSFDCQERAQREVDVTYKCFLWRHAVMLRVDIQLFVRSIQTSAIDRGDW